MPRGRARIAVAAGLVVALVFGLTAAYAVFRPSQALGAQATLTILTGTVEVREAGGSSFASGADGGVLGPGATIKTAADGNAIVTFFDGSTVTIEPSSELTLEQMEASSDGDMLISILQTVGRSWHVVGHKLSDDSNYQVRTATATASVRGTAFQFDVDQEGNAETLTEEGTVGFGAAGTFVDVGPEQFAIAEVNAPPSEPEPAPPPDNLVKVIIDPTNTAAAVDSKGRSVAIIDGKPSITVPRGSVEYVGDKIVMSVPVDGDERVSTVVQPTDPTEAVAIQTQVETNGVITNNTVELRVPDESGLAKGGVALTSAGLIVLSDEEAQKFVAPNIAAPPPLPQTDGFFAQQFVAPTTDRLPELPQIQIVTLPEGAAPPTVFALPEGFEAPADFVVGQFNGGFQQTSFFGFTENVTKIEGFDPTKAPNLEISSSGLVDAPTTFNYATFAGAMPEGMVPPPPPSATDFARLAGFNIPANFVPPVRPQGAAPAAGGAAPAFDPSLIPQLNASPEVQQQLQQRFAQFQQIATQLQQSGAFTAPPSAPGAAPAGAPGAADPNARAPQAFPFAQILPFPGTGGPTDPAAGAGVGPSPFQGNLPAGCVSLGVLGVRCENVTPPAGAPGAVPPGGPFIGSPPPGFTGTFPPGVGPGGSSQPGVPFTGSPPPGFTGSFPPGTGSFPPGAPLPPSTTFLPGAFPSGAPLPTGGFVTPPPGATFLPFPSGAPLPTGGFVTPLPGSAFPAPANCAPPDVPLPDGKCGPAPTFTGTFPPSGSFSPPPDQSFTPPPGGSFTPPPGEFTPPPGSTTPPPTFGGTPPPEQQFTPPPEQQFTPPPTNEAPPPPPPTNEAPPPTFP